MEKLKSFGTVKMKVTHFTFLLVLILISCSSKPSSYKVRESSLSGKWYSANPNTLASTIDQLLKNSISTKFKSNNFLFILPHAGYPYSGQVAANGYNAIRSLNPDIIVIIGPAHYGGFYGCSLLPVDYYETPLGRVKVEKKIDLHLIKQALEAKHFSIFEQAWKLIETNYKPKDRDKILKQLEKVELRGGYKH